MQSAPKKYYDTFQKQEREIDIIYILYLCYIVTVFLGYDGQNQKPYSSLNVYADTYTKLKQFFF